MISIAIAIFWLVLDQLTKIILPKVMSWYETIEIIPGVLNISLVKNYGAAFGMLAGKSWLLVPIAVVFVVYLIVEREKINSIPLARWGAPLAAAGALGNAIDRAFLGYVVDFIDVPFFSVFNVADIGITIGIFLLLFGLVLNERNHKDGASDV